MLLRPGGRVSKAGHEVTPTVLFQLLQGIEKRLEGHLSAKGSPPRVDPQCGNYGKSYFCVLCQSVTKAMQSFGNWCNREKDKKSNTSKKEGTEEGEGSGLLVLRPK